jgi:tRNA pseudouridine55 synthase
MPSSVDGIVLLAKQSGITSFSSLWQIKNALGTKKIGHTGTLDTFAEGLLVALAGRYTRLVPFFSNGDKEYLAEIRFGVETDTLDPDGAAVREASLPTLRAIDSSFPAFRGDILQKPPAFSALHVNGQRASDLMRKGIAVDIAPRAVTIHALEIISAYDPTGRDSAPDSPVQAMVVRVVCSKGTYIRSLARDIAEAAGSCAHLSALRRTRIGPFSLERAAGSSLLAPFPASLRGVYGKGDKPPQAPSDEILASVIPLTPEIALTAGLGTVFLNPERLDAFAHGRKPEPSWFSAQDGDQALSPHTTRVSPNSGEASPDARKAVFCGTDFMGVVAFSSGTVRYEFVAEGAS